MLEANLLGGIREFLFSSASCVYTQSKQNGPRVIPLREEDAYPADPEPGYCWEKLFTEELCKYFRRGYGMQARVTRFHNVYRPLGTCERGKEESPATLYRRGALAESGDEVEICGDGEQTRWYMYIDDCVESPTRLMASSHCEPRKKLCVQHDLSKPQGVRGRNSDNTRLLQVLAWEPPTPLGDGPTVTYLWIQSALRKSGRVPAQEKKDAAA